MRAWGRPARPKALDAGSDRLTAADRLTALVQTHAGDVLAYLQRRTPTVEDAADLLSETFAVAWRRVAELPHDDERARMWLFTTARNALANHHRGQRRASDLSVRLRKELVADNRTRGPGVHDSVLDAVSEAIEQLPPAQQELVTLIHWDGLSLVQAAEVIAIPASTTRSRYASARAQLAEHLQSRRQAPSPHPPDPSPPPMTPPHVGVIVLPLRP